MHRLNLTIPEDLVRRVQHIALDANLNLSEIVEAHFEEIATTKKLPPVKKRERPPKSTTQGDSSRTGQD